MLFSLELTLRIVLFFNALWLRVRFYLDDVFGSYGGVFGVQFIDFLVVALLMYRLDSERICGNDLGSWCRNL